MTTSLTKLEGTSILSLSSHFMRSKSIPFFTFSRVSLVVSIGVSNNAFNNAGRKPLSNKEKQIIKNAGYKEKDIDAVEIDIKNVILK